MRTIGRRRKLRARTGERQRDDAHLADLRRHRQDLDLRDAGNRARRPDRDQKAVRPCMRVEEDVGAADVS